MTITTTRQRAREQLSLLALFVLGFLADLARCPVLAMST